MKLEDIVNNNSRVNVDEISQDAELARQLQTVLINFGFLDPPVDGKFGPISKLALRQFGTRVQIDAHDFLGAELAEALLTKTVDEVAPIDLTGNDLATRIIKYMQLQGYWFPRLQGYLNIVYVEGLDESGALNDDKPDLFNDCRMLISIEQTRPKIVGRWQATTEPGKHYTDNPPAGVAALGVARIAFGQFKAWNVGTHHGFSGLHPHEALVQVDKIKIFRDLNKDFIRTGDVSYEGIFAINQHSGFGHPGMTIGMTSAGCLVGLTHAGHQQFMQLVKSDPRFIERSGYTFMTTVIAGDKFFEAVP